MREITFEVHGAPVPKGSWKAVQWHAKDGRSGVGLKPDNEGELRSWTARVVDAAVQARVAAGIDSPFLAASVEMMFSYPRPQGQYLKGGRVSPSAPAEKITKPDLDKLVRAIYDSLTQAYLVPDDNAIVESHERKEFGEPKVRVAVTELELRQIPPLEVTVDGPAPEERQEQRTFRQITHPGRDRG